MAPAKINLHTFDEVKGRFIYFTDLPPQRHVETIYEDSEGLIWFGKRNVKYPFSSYNKATGKLKKYLPKYYGSHKGELFTVISIYEDSNGEMWFGTNDGINILDKEKDSISLIDERDGLESNIVLGILEDDHKNIWISTNNGLSRYDTEKKEFKTYDKDDGLQGQEFTMHAYLKTKDGNFIFGGKNGFNIFNPLDIYENEIPPQIVFTDFKIYNQSVNICQSEGKKVHGFSLEKDISSINSITLNHEQNYITFHFAALNYSNSSKNEYTYKLEGFDDKNGEQGWRNVGNQRFATYTNLDPGHYIFRVRASNNDGKWNNKGIAMKLIILPPFWKTWWFRILAGIAIVGVIVMKKKTQKKMILI